METEKVTRGATRRPSVRRARSGVGGEGGGEDVETLVEQLVTGDERWQETEDVAEGAAGEGDQALLVAVGVDGLGEAGVGGLRGPVGHELDGEHRAAAPDVADLLVPLGQRLEPRAEERLDLARATGEVVLGVDLGKLADDDARYDEATRTAYIHLPAPEVLSTRLDEPHSYVHARTTEMLAKRNEALESVARRDATIAFEAAAKDPKNVDRAKAQAEKQLRALGRAWGARDVVITWRPEGSTLGTML